MCTHVNVNAHEENAQTHVLTHTYEEENNITTVGII